jgi:hypothetical protein
MAQSEPHSELCRRWFHAGRVDGMQAAVLALVELRLGWVPADVEAQVRGCGGHAELRRLLRSLASAGDEEAVRAVLG